MSTPTTQDDAPQAPEPEVPVVPVAAPALPGIFDRLRNAIQANREERADRREVERLRDELTLRDAQMERLQNELEALAAEVESLSEQQTTTERRAVDLVADMGVPARDLPTPGAEAESRSAEELRAALKTAKSEEEKRAIVAELRALRGFELITK